ncbi:unnamed protein product, partial [Ilex paraguariensis]
MERRCAWAFMVLLGMTMVILGEVTMVHANGGQLSPSQCNSERQLLTNACRPVVFGQPATPVCCQRVRISHFECICPMFTPKLASILGVHTGSLSYFKVVEGGFHVTSNVA